jgi:hypothetical protein
VVSVAIVGEGYSATHTYGPLHADLNIFGKWHRNRYIYVPHLYAILSRFS